MEGEDDDDDEEEGDGALSAGIILNDDAGPGEGGAFRDVAANGCSSSADGGRCLILVFESGIEAGAMGACGNGDKPDDPRRLRDDDEAVEFADIIDVADNLGTDRRGGG